MSTFKPKFTTLDAIKAETRKIARQQNTVASRIQHVATSVLAHIAEHGDWTVAVNFRDEITASNGVRKQALTDYLEAMLHGQFSKEGFAYDKKHSHQTINLEQAAAVNWYDFKRKNAKATAKTLAELLEYVTKQGAKSVKAGKIEQSALDTIVGTFEAEISNTAPVKLAKTA